MTLILTASRAQKRTPAPQHCGAGVRAPI